MKVLSIRTEREKAWTLFKLVDKYNDGIREIDNSHEDYVEIQFQVKPIFWSDKLGERILMRQANKALL